MAAPVLAASPPPPRQAEAQAGGAAPVAPVAAAAINAIDVASVESTTLLKNEQTAKNSADQASARARSGQAAGQIASAKASQADVGAMTPAAWLAKVRNLRSEGRLGEARNSLELFHRYYPQYVIPADLSPLLRE